jgi:tRNA pseudouridine38-40 synthase
MPRYKLIIEYDGGPFCGWQLQDNGASVQGALETAVKAICGEQVRVHGAGRTDAGVHALNQVVHFDSPVTRAAHSWIRGTNRYLPADIAVQWCRLVPDSFHSRASAVGRRYVYVLLESAVRPALENGLAGWSFRTLDGDAMRQAAAALLGEHDFTAFRSAECQALSPIKTMRELSIERRGAYWRFSFDADAFLHHMIRNVVGCLTAVGEGSRPVRWLADVLESRDRSQAAATFSPDGLYFQGPYYDPVHGIPDRTAAMDWLP